MVVQNKDGDGVGTHPELQSARSAPNYSFGPGYPISIAGTSVIHRLLQPSCPSLSQLVPLTKPTQQRDVYQCLATTEVRQLVARNHLIINPATLSP
jgi:hypothetical protein